MAVSQGIVESSSQGSEQEQQQQQGATRSKLVQRLLTAGANLPAFINDLLTTQAVVVAGTEAAAFIIEKQPVQEQEQEQQEGLGLRPIAHLRPDQSDAQARTAALQAFQNILRPCILQSKDGALEVGNPDEAGESQYCLVTLLRSDGQIVAVSAVITRCRNLERARQRLMSMQLVAGYFELYSLKRLSEQSRTIAQSHQSVLQLATAVATADGFESAAMNLCNELATRTGATRVSIGWLKGRKIKVKALSHTEKFDKKQELIVQLEQVMEECLDQEEVVHFDGEGGSSPNVTRSAQGLSRANAGEVVLSLPLRRKDEIEGVVTLEFPPKHKLGEHAASGLMVAVDLLAPQLYDRHENDRWLITKAGVSVKNLTKQAIGPKHTLAKLLIAVGIVVVLVLFNWIPFVDTRMTYRVSAPFQFVPLTKRVLNAPFDGQIDRLATVDGREMVPGMVVKKGQILLTMETTELKNKLRKSETEAIAYRQEAADARTNKQDPAKEEIALWNAKRAEAEAALYRDQIAMATITSPTDGQILKGDLRDKQGSTVRQGEPLFEVGPLAPLEAELVVAERDIQEIQNNQHGQLATTSLPTWKYPFTVARIVPLGEAKEGDNGFKVYAALDKAQPDWRPGMNGEAKVEIRKERLAWIWTHKFADWVAMKWWSWSPF